MLKAKKPARNKKITIIQPRVDINKKKRDLINYISNIELSPYTLDILCDVAKRKIPR